PTAVSAASILSRASAFDLADRFHLPVITFVDTAGAYPGVASEERGVAEAIAKSIESCLKVQVPSWPPSPPEITTPLSGPSSSNSSPTAKNPSSPSSPSCASSSSSPTPNSDLNPN
ncbi:hypothetical protein BWR60_33695, partial [Inquilinus limosus]